MWGASYLVIKIALRDLGPIALVGIRVILSAFLVLFILLTEVGAGRVRLVTCRAPSWRASQDRLRSDRARTGFVMATCCASVLPGRGGASTS